MRRIMMVLSVALVMAVMLAASSTAAFAFEEMDEIVALRNSTACQADYYSPAVEYSASGCSVYFPSPPSPR